MLTALRREVQDALAGVRTSRKAALRRTEDPRALLMCDLPRIAGAGDIAAFVERLEKAGWRILPTEGWLLLDKPVPVPEPAWPEAFPGEWGCLVWMLKQHPEGAAAQEDIRALVKAADVGPGRVEWLCRQWHGQWAARLRRHENLPGGLLPYLLAVRRNAE